MHFSRDHHDAIEAYADNIIRRSHRGLWIALALYGVGLGWLCWKLS